MIAIMMALASVPTSAADLYRQCQHYEKSCDEFLEIAAATTPDLCLHGRPIPPGTRLEGVYTGGIERQPARLKLSAMEAAQQTIHDAMGCMDDHDRKMQRER